LRQTTAEEKELIKHLRLNLLLKLFASGGQSRWSATYQGGLPFIPGNAIVDFQRAEESIVLKQWRIAGESFKGAAQIRVSRPPVRS